MSTLVIFLPPRPRPDATPESTAPGSEASAEPRSAPEFGYVLSADGLVVTRQGCAAAALLPRADSVVLVLPDTEIGWHRVNLPRAPAHRLRAALAGVIEEELLEDDDVVHLAVAPQPRAGEPTWVAALHRPWLQGQIDALDSAGLNPERVVPASWPGEPAQGHFFTDHFADPAAGDDSLAPVWLALSDADGVACLRLAGGLARALLPAWTARPTRWTATPGAAAQAERWLGAPVAVLTDAERALQALRSRWNLRQFELAPRRRGARALGELGRRLLSPSWRAARLGLAMLVLVQIIGLNLWAWHQQRALGERRAAMTALLRASHPQVRAVLDAPLQMRRETEALRASAGRVGAADFEPMLAAAALAWPQDQPPVQSLRFEPGRLSLAAAGWNAAQIEQFRTRLQAAGWSVEAAAGRVTLSPAATPMGIRS